MNDLEDDMTKWPSVDLGKIFAYVISNKAFSTEYVGQYKIRKAYTPILKVDLFIRFV